MNCDYCDYGVDILQGLRVLYKCSTYSFPRLVESLANE